MSLRPFRTWLAFLGLCALLLCVPVAAQERAVQPDGDALPPGAVARLGNTNFWHGSAGLTLAYSPKAGLLASHGNVGRICLWDAATGKLVRALEMAPPGDLPVAIASRTTFQGPALVFAADGKTLALADFASQRYRVWEVATGKELASAPMEQSEAEPAPVKGKKGKGFGKGAVIPGAPAKGAAKWGAAPGLLGQGAPARGVQDKGADEKGAPEKGAEDKGTRGKGGPDKGAPEDGVPPKGKAKKGKGKGGAPGGGFGGKGAPGGGGFGGGGKGGPGGFALRTLPTAGPFALSPDGRTLAAGGKGDTVVVWDLAKGAERWRLKGHEGKLYALAFAPDGKALLSGSDDQTARLWDLADGKEIRVFEGHRGPVQTVAFTPDGRRLLSASLDGTVRLCDRGSGKALLEGRWGTAVVPDVSPFASALASALMAPTLHVWADANGKTVSCFFSQSGYPVSSLRSSTRVDGLVIWDAATGKEVRRRSFQTTMAPGTVAARAAALMTAGTVVASERNWFARPSTSQHVQFFSLETGEIQPGPGGGGAAVTDVAIAGDRVAFTRQGDLAVSVWTWRGDGGVRRLEGHTGAPSILRFAPDGNTLISGSADAGDRSLSVWDVALGAEARRLRGWQAGPPVPASGFISRRNATVHSSPELSPEGTLVVFRGTDGKLRVADRKTGKLVAQFDVNWQGHGCVAWTPDGKLVVADSVDGGAAGFAARNDVECTLRVLDVKGGAARQVRKSPYGFQAMRLAVAGRHALLACRDGMIRGVDLTTGEEVRTVGDGPDDKGPLGNPVPKFASTLLDRSPSFVLAPDGRTVAILSTSDQSIRLVELATNRERARFSGHPGAIQAMGFSPDGRYLVSGSLDGTVLVWAVTLPASKAGKATRLTAQEAEAVWADLLGDDAVKGLEAVRKLTAAPEQAVEVLRARLKSTPALKEAEVQEKARDLDSKNFFRREKAVKELTAMGEAVTPLLEKCLKQGPSYEVMVRIESILKQFKGGPVSGEALREVRAVEALEALGTEVARAALRQLAEGAPGARLTREAREALERLAVRTAAR
jgi:WD40 repeat protein